MEESRIWPDRSPFYVKCAQAFVDFTSGKRLLDRSRGDIEGLPADLGKRAGMAECQVRQA